MKRAFIYIFLISALFCSCQDRETLESVPVESGQEIRVGGITLSDELITDVSYSATRAAKEVDAETQDWLVGPLKSGLDITYGLPNDNSTRKVAILKLTNDSGTGIDHVGDGDDQYAVDADSKLAIYSFKYRDSADGDNAVWYGNGSHFFEGVYVPNQIRYGQGVGDASRNDKASVNSVSAPNILTDQHVSGESDGVTGNYTLLERYLGMPANTRRSATVARIKLPFSHRLARVLAYVLIDPTMGSDVKLEGYKKSITDNKIDVEDEDPTNTSLSFCNVDVLEGVLDEKSDGNDHHTLTPQWKNVRKVTPHFVGERASLNSKQEIVDANDFIVYFNTSNDTYIFPTEDSRWTEAKTAYEAAYNKATGTTDAEKAAQATASSHYRQIKYGKVPVYDIILRPTYTSVDNVMYDEEGVKKADGTEDKEQKQYYNGLTNNIDFELTLNNGLQYYKKVSIDLDANRQTVIYLRLNRESVDYNSSGSELWVSETKDDDWYGVDNLGGHSLSDAGSSWQRAYTIGETVSDDKVTDGGYYNEATSTAVNTRGQYLKDDATWIEYFAQACEGGAHHGDYFVLKKDITIDAAQLPVGFVFTGHLDAQDHVITVTGTDSWALCTDEVFSILKQKTGDDYVEIPQLYYFREEAQAHPRQGAHTRSIDRGYPILVEKSKTTPADVGEYVLYTYNEFTQDYEVYTNRQFYKKTGSALLCGLNGIYTTKQETEEAAGRSIYQTTWEWEANVHKNNNVWVPYRDITDADPANHTGWRAEIINLKVKGNLFEPDATVSGNVQNCYQGTNGNIKVKDHVPAIPKYN